MELWDIYDRDRIRTGRIMERGTEIPEDGYHMVIHVCVFNGAGQMLIQRRQLFKAGWAGMWDVTVGGSSVAGETSAEAAARELREEVGIDVDFSDIRPHLTVNYRDGFDDFYLIEREVDPSSLHLQYEEVEQVRWATLDEILAMIENGQFIEYYPDFMKFLFAHRGRYGAHMKK